jgi:hypothetical protein
MNSPAFPIGSGVLIDCLYGVAIKKFAIKI